MPLPFNTSSLTSSLRSTIANNQPSLLNNIEKLSSQASSFAQKTGVFGPLHTGQQPAGPSTNQQQHQQQQQSQRNAAQTGPNNTSSSGSNMINRGNNNNNGDLRQSLSVASNNPAQGARNLAQNVAAPAGGAGSGGPPVDLSHLTAEERAMIQSVMAKAEMVDSGKLPVDTTIPSSANLPSQTSQALIMQQHQSHMNSMGPSFNSQMVQPNHQGQQQQQLMNNTNQMQPQQQQQQPYRQPMSMQMSDQNNASFSSGQQQHANPLIGQFNQMMQPTSQQQTAQPLQQQQPQQTFHQQSIGPNQQQHMNLGPSNTNQLASLEQQTQQLVNQINSQFNLGGANQSQQQVDRINQQPQQQQQPQQSVNQMMVGPGGYGQPTTSDMMAVNSQSRGQLQHQQSLTSQPSVFTMSGGGQSLPYANSVQQQQQQQPPSNQLLQQQPQQQMQPQAQVSGGIMPGAYNSLANQQAGQLATMPTMQQQQPPQSILMSQQNYPNNSIDVMLQQQQQQQQQHQNNLQLMALQQQQRQLSFDQNQSQFSQPTMNALAANYQATASFLPQNLGAIYSAQQGMPTCLGGGDGGGRARQSIRFKRDRSWHQEHAISDQENDESRVSSRNSRRGRAAPAGNLGQLRRFDSASEVMPQREGAGRQLPRPGKLQPAGASLSRMQSLGDDGERTRQTRPKRFSRARRNQRALSREADESDLSCRSSSASELSISSADPPPSQQRDWRHQLAAPPNETKRAPERRKATKRDEVDLAPRTQASESAAPQLVERPVEKVVLNELKLTEQANRVMEQQQQLIKQSQDLIKLQQAQLEQKAVSIASGTLPAQVGLAAADTVVPSKSVDEPKSTLVREEVSSQLESDRALKIHGQVCEQTGHTVTVEPAKASAATDTHDLPVASDSPGPLDYEPLPGTRPSTARRSPGLSRQQHTSTSKHDLYADQHQHHHQRAPMLATRASSLRAAKLVVGQLADSPTDTTDSDLEMLSSRLTPLGGRRHHHHRSGRHTTLTPTSGTTLVSGKQGRAAAVLARARRQPAGLPASPLPVAAAIQLHQLQQQQQHHHNSRSYAPGMELNARSRSVCNSPQQQQHWRTATGGYSTRPCSPADVAALCHDYGQRKQLPDPPSNAVPLTPSMVRKMVQGQRAAATNSSKLLASVNAQSTLLTNMHSQRQPCLDRLPAHTAPYAAANQATAGTLRDAYGEQRQVAIAREQSINNKSGLGYCATPGSYTAKLSGAQVSFADDPVELELRDTSARSNLMSAIISGRTTTTTELGKFLDSTYGTSILKQQQQQLSANVHTARTDQQVDQLMGNLDSFYGLDKRSDLLRENVLDAISSRSHYDARLSGSPSLTRRRRTDVDAHGSLTAGYSRLPAAVSYTPSGSYAVGSNLFSGRRSSEGELTYLSTSRQHERPFAYGQAAGRRVMFGSHQQQQRVTRQSSGAAAYELSPNRLASPMRVPHSSLPATARQRLAGYGDTHAPVGSANHQRCDDENTDDLLSTSRYRARDKLVDRPLATGHANYSRPESGAIQRLRSLGSSGTSLAGPARRLNYANWSPITASAADNFAPAGRASYLQRPPGRRMISDCQPGGSGGGGFTQYEGRQRIAPSAMTTSGQSQLGGGRCRLGNYQPRSFDLG